MRVDTTRSVLVWLFLWLVPNAVQASDDGFDLYQVYTFEVEEGILLQEKIIANITLEKYGVNEYFLYDEPYFIKPSNRKSPPQPRLFDIKFLNATQPEEITTPAPRLRRDVGDANENSGSGILSATAIYDSDNHTAEYNGSPLSSGNNSTGLPYVSVGTTSWTNTNTSESYTPNMPSRVDPGENGTNATSNISVTTSKNSQIYDTTIITTTEEGVGSTGSTLNATEPTASLLTTKQSTTGGDTRHTASPSKWSNTTAGMTSVTPDTRHNDTRTTTQGTNTPMAHVTTLMTSPTTTAPTNGSAGISVIAQLSQIYDLDREKADTHYLTINTYDKNNMIDMPIIVRIKVTDKNDNNPVFDTNSLTTEITKDTKLGEVVAQLKATDADIGTNADIRYKLLPFTERINSAKESPEITTFSVHEKYGLVFLMRPIESFEVPSRITFNVVAKDRGNDIAANRATATVTVSIVEQGDNTTTLPPEKKVSSGVIIGVSVAGSVILLTIVVFLVLRYRRRKIRRDDGQLAFMLDDDHLIVP